MADKLFHVFISSTYSDLIDERSRVSEALSKAGQVPEGMEIFPASSQKQIDFIKRVIDRCDYYVVIIAGRYGSTIPAGESFTELEYEYAVQKGLPTLAFLHSQPEKLDQSKIEPDAEKSKRLAAFRQRIEQNGLVDYWSAPDQLATKVVAAIAQEVSTNPGIGWIRGDRAASEELLNEINELRKSNDELRRSLADSKPVLAIANLANLNEKFPIHYEYRMYRNASLLKSEVHLTWEDILRIVGPEFRTPHNAAAVSKALERYLKDVAGQSYHHISFSSTDRERILNQLELLGFMKSDVYNLQTGGQALFYKLTSKGVSEVLRLNAVTSSKA
jgi:hypothetical protein